MKQAMVVGVLALVSCAGAGDVQFTTWGEQYIEQGIGSAEGDEAGFADGWSLKYEKFLVTLSEVTIADDSGKPAATMAEAKVMDLTKPGPVEVVRFDQLPAQRWSEVSYAIKPSLSSVAGSASQVDVELMHSNGYGVYIEATATKGGVSKHIAWGFQLDTHYEHCEQQATGAGLVVPAGGQDTVQLTVHGDHFWFDDLQSPESKMRWQAIADADRSPADGTVTLEELEAVDLSSLPLTQYGTGSVSGVKNLRQFVSSLSRTIGHYRGEGECTARARDTVNN